MNAIDIPDDFTFEMVVETECPDCGCQEYKPGTLTIVNGCPPLNVDECVDCGRIRLMVSKYLLDREAKK